MTKKQERRGINKVTEVVTEDWFCDWQEFDSANDEGIDGIIIMRRGHKSPTTTGGVIYTQVKCGDGYKKTIKKHPDKICINLGKIYIEQHRPRWNVAPGKAVLIYVEDTEEKRAWWVDLKNDSSYSSTNSSIVLIPKSQTFDKHTKGAFHKLCGPTVSDRKLMTVKMRRDHDFFPSISKNNQGIRHQAWEHYKKIREKHPKGLQTNIPDLGRILINRTGWKHITRNTRKQERILQSFLLLGSAEQIMCQSQNYITLGNAREEQDSSGRQGITDYLGLRAVVEYTYRHHSVVQVVIKRFRTFSKNGASRQTLWFYSVYELRRGKGFI